MNTRAQRATAFIVRVVLTFFALALLASLGLWQWAWLFLGFSVFAEIAAIGLILTEELRSIAKWGKP